MPKGWPDPLNDRGDNFWDFDNMVNEYEYEQERKRKRQISAPQPKDQHVVSKKGVTIVCLICAIIIFLFVCIPVALVLGFVLLWQLFKDV